MFVEFIHYNYDLRKKDIDLHFGAFGWRLNCVFLLRSIGVAVGSIKALRHWPFAREIHRWPVILFLLPPVLSLAYNMIWPMTKHWGMNSIDLVLSMLTDTFLAFTQV